MPIKNMNKKPYDIIGANYNKNRNADKRILNFVRELLELPVGSTICDIGAGTSNYSNELATLGYKIKAIEPSENMKNQAIENKNLTCAFHFISM